MDLKYQVSHVVWSRAWVGMVLTCVLSLSVHVVMLQVLHVPFPEGYPTTGLPALGNQALASLGLILFYRLSLEALAPWKLPARCLLLFLITAMLREALIRGPVMNGVVTTAWTYSLVASLPSLLTMLVLSCLVVWVTPRLVRPWQIILGALVIVLLVLGCKIVIGLGMRPILQSISYLGHDPIYNPPYGWQVLIPGYLTFMEPVVACFSMAALVWNRLSQDMLLRTAQFTLFVLVISGKLLMPFIYVFYAPFPAGVALSSMGQFFLEVLTLALLTAVTWRLCQKGSLEPRINTPRTGF